MSNKGSHFQEASSMVESSKSSGRWKVKLWPRLSRRQWITAIVLAFGDFLTAVCTSLQSPFYPAEAERKGATPSQYGFVFGCFHLTVFLTCPIYGKYLPVLKPHRMINWGLFLTGVCLILFGTLDYIEDSEMFIGFSFAVRIVEALGNSAFTTAAYAVIAAEFPDNVASTFACLETFFGVGLIVGPAFGGFLYQLGGYLLPFLVLGLLLVTASLVSCALLPQSQLFPQRSGGLLKLLRIPSVLLASYSAFAGSIAIGFLSATLEPHLRPFGLTPLELGSMFIIEGTTCALSAPLWGYLCDKVLSSNIVALIGALLSLTGFILIGPAPFVPLETSLPLVIVGLVASAFGVEGLLVSGFAASIQQATNEHGFPNDLSTYGLVSGMWMSTFALGAFVGPSVAGVLIDHFGFRNGTYFVMIVDIILVVCVILFFVFSRSDKRLSFGISCKVPGKQHSGYDRIPDSNDGDDDGNGNILQNI